MCEMFDNVGIATREGDNAIYCIIRIMDSAIFSV